MEVVRLNAGAGKQATSRTRQQQAMKVLIAAVVASLLAVAVGQPPMALKLERRLANASTKQLVAMDELRQTKIGGGAVQLPVSGSGDDYLAGGPYLTRVNLGNPPKSYGVVIDTGSSTSWVACQTAAGSSTQPGLFDPRLSSTSSVLTCSDKRCKEIVHDRSGVCNTSSDSCVYNMNYGPGSDVLSTAAGYFLSDMVYLEILNGSQQTSTCPVPIIFGCANSRTGDLAHEAFDGILGFGPSPISFSSQVYSLGLSPVFSLCMKRSYGGGTLVFGKPLELGIVYTPLLQEQDYYGLNLESIYVNGQKLGLDPSVFRPSAGYQTFADSGTSLAYLASEAYGPFVSAIAAAVSPSANPTVKSGDQHCFVPSSSIDSSFPSVTLHFVGGAAMQLKPKNYLRSIDNSVYCIAWQRNEQRVTILGDIVLADKLLVHDLQNMLFGWLEFNCSQPFHVTTSSEKKNVNSAHASQKISMPIATVLITFSLIFRP